MKTHYDISLMDKSMINYMKNNDGLCFNRFHADIITEDIDYLKLKVGDVIETNNKKIRLTRIGKPCFKECNFKDKPCKLSKYVAFGEVF